MAQGDAAAGGGGDVELSRAVRVLPLVYGTDLLFFGPTRIASCETLPRHFPSQLPFPS